MAPPPPSRAPSLFIKRVVILGTHYAAAAAVKGKYVRANALPYPFVQKLFPSLYIAQKNTGFRLTQRSA